MDAKKRKFEKKPHSAKPSSSSDASKKQPQAGKGPRSAENGDKGKFKKGPRLGEKRKSETSKEDLRKIRKTDKNPIFSMIQEAKPTWERIRNGELKDPERGVLIAQMLTPLLGKLKQLTFKHDSVRMIQDCFRFGTLEEKRQIFNELKSDILELSMSKYSKFLIPKFLEYGNKEQRDVILEAFFGHVRKMIKHSIASHVLDDAYVKYANAAQKQHLVEEFYGPHFALFKANEKRTLEDIFVAEPEKKSYVLKHLRDSLTPLLEKGTSALYIVHRALLDYMTYADETNVLEIIAIIKEFVVEMLHTKDGYKIAQRCLWMSDAKDRKLIIKSFKEHVSKICMSEHGFQVLLALFDVVDDTVLVGKSILAPLIDDLAQIIATPQGKKVLLYLLAPRSTLYFAPPVIAELAQGDSNKHSKKDAELRRNELKAQIIEPLFKYIVENAGDMLRQGADSQLLFEAISNYTGDRTPFFDAVIALVSNEPFVDEEHLLSHRVSHLFLKRLVPLRAKESDSTSRNFGEMLSSVLSKELVQKAAVVNRSAFVLGALAEHTSARDQLKTWLASLKGDLVSHDMAGPKNLAKVLFG